jgi:hypothetical protein
VPSDAGPAASGFIDRFGATITFQSLTFDFP